MPHLPPFTVLLQLMRFCQALLTNSEGKDEQVSGFCCLLWTLYHVTYFFSLSNEGVMKEEHSLPAQLHVAAMSAWPFVVQMGVYENHRNVIMVLCVCVCGCTVGGVHSLAGSPDSDGTCTTQATKRKDNKSKGITTHLWYRFG